MDTPSTPASEFPLMVYQGQMISRESASARLEALKTDADFQQRAAALDPEAFRLHTELWRLSRGMSPEPVTVVNTADVTQQSNERAAAEASRRLEMYLAKGFSNEAAYQIVNQRPIPFAEKQTHERELVRLRNDTAFMARYRAGDRDAILEHDSRVVAMSLPVGSLADINRWEVAHGRPPSK